MEQSLPPVLVLFGPTASGKTGLALQLAQALSAEIINADSRQLYTRMPIITACPTAHEYATVPHHLFEVLDPATRASAAAWATQARTVIGEVLSRGKLPFLVGGTGLYLRTLMEGLSEVPEVPPEVEAQFNGQNVLELYTQLNAVDPELAAKLHPTDTQRIVRALAVQAATGTPLSVWQQGEKKGAPFTFIKLGLMPGREELHARIHKRWLKMVDAGVVGEVAALQAAGYTPDMPGLTGLGIPQFFQYLEGGCQLEDAIQAGATAHRQYAKRQCTWLGNTYKPDFLQQMPSAAAVLSYLRNRFGSAQ